MNLPHISQSCKTIVITSAFIINGLSDLKKLTKTEYGRF